MVDLMDRVCLVTGAGRGLGKAIVKALGQAGCVIAGVDIHQELLDQMEVELSDMEIPFFPIKADVSSEADVQRLMEQVFERYGRLDALINNAGVDVTLPIDEL